MKMAQRHSAAYSPPWRLPPNSGERKLRRETLPEAYAGKGGIFRRLRGPRRLLLPFRIACGALRAIMPNSGPSWKSSIIPKLSRGAGQDQSERKIRQKKRLSSIPAITESTAAYITRRENC